MCKPLRETRIAGIINRQWSVVAQHFAENCARFSFDVANQLAAVTSNGRVAKHLRTVNQPEAAGLDVHHTGRTVANNWSQFEEFDRRVERLANIVELCEACDRAQHSGPHRFLPTASNDGWCSKFGKLIEQRQVPVCKRRPLNVDGLD